jgi:hypothetical protein
MFGAALAAIALLAQVDGSDHFEKNVRPILVRSCLGCHSAASKPVMGGLKLDTREALLQGGSRGASVVPGKPAESLFLQAVLHNSGALKMPPGPKLKDAEIAVLTEWIAMGAPWGKSPSIGKQPEQFWAFAPPIAKPGSIDSFLNAARENNGLRPAKPASRRTLIRRVSYDLTGLPPTPEDVEAFLADQSPGAYSKLIDRYLASPRYGERWGRHWLDVARYADSNGLDENLVYKNAWRYRDYVIAAFNKDKPFNEFLTEQIAGDLLPESPDPQVQYERWTATGFLSLGAKMLAEDDPVKMQMDIVDEQLDTTMRAFQGLTVGCARCHDHKFDPIPTKDYYALAGIFKSAKTMENFKVVAKWHEYVLAPKEDRDRLAAHEAKIEAKGKEISALTGAQNKTIKAEAAARVGAYLQASAALRADAELRIAPAESLAQGIVIESAAMRSGNANKTLEKKKANIADGAKGPFWAEYEVNVPAAARYQLDVQDQESGQGTPDIYVNGAWIVRGEAPVNNRQASPDAGGWKYLAVVDLPAGNSVLKLEHARRFPYFTRLLLTNFDGPRAPRTTVQIARHFNVNPSILEQLEDYFDRSQGAEASVLHSWEVNRDPAAVERLSAEFQAKFADAANHPAIQTFLAEKFGPFRAPEDARRYYPEELKTKLAALEAERTQLEESKPVFPQAMGVREGDKIEDIPIHTRGSHWTLGAIAPRGILSAVPGVAPPAIPASESGRLQLAQWMTDPKHPLTGRVIVNRIWRWHFGRGIVSTVDNFGRLGDKPSHPELLDYLAANFVANGWSVKKLHKEILLSDAYQMSADYDARATEIDPENVYLWRMPRRRLEGEAVRDGILAASGSLQFDAQGSILKYKDRQYVANTSKGGDVDYDRPVRAVYLPVVRSSLYDVFSAFDLPDPTTSNGDRDSTVVAPQALFMLNSSVMLRHSENFAGRLLALPEKDRVNEAYRRALSRPATPKEIDQALSFVARMQSEWKDEKKAWQSFVKALFSSSEMIYLN